MNEYLQKFFSLQMTQQALKHFPKLHWEEFFPAESNNEGVVHVTAVVGKRVKVGIETQIDPFVVIEDDVVIGKHCLIRSGSLIRSGTVIGDNCVIGHGSEIKQSFLSDEAKIGSHCFVGNSVFGKGARMGSGSITGNRRFDQTEINWQLKESKRASGHDKLGVLIGDYARLGANVTTNPGTIIGSYTWVSGGQVINGFVDEKKFVKPNGVVAENNNSSTLNKHDTLGKL